VAFSASYQLNYSVQKQLTKSNSLPNERGNLRTTTAIMESSTIHLLTLLQKYYPIATVHVSLQDSPGVL